MGKVIAIWVTAWAIRLAFYLLVAKGIIYCAAGLGGPILPFWPVFGAAVLASVLLGKRN